MDDSLHIQATLAIPAEELRFSMSRAGGPGGQHVNVTNSRVSLSWSVRDSAVLDEQQRSLLLQRLGSRLSNEGVLQVSVDSERSQHRNRELALERLAELVRRALVQQAVRHETAVPRSVKRKRVEDKRQRASIKKGRARPDVD